MKKSELLISVLIPVYNARTYLKECIDSILNQTYRNIEVILVDDGSTDGSGEICDTYAVTDARIRVIHKENSGVVDTRKIGSQHASGSYCICVDSDDWLDNSYIERMVNIIAEYDADVICCGFIKTDGTTYNHIQNGFRAGHYTREQLDTEIMPYCLSGKNGDSFPINLWAKAYKTDLCREMLSAVESGMPFSEDLCSIVYALFQCCSLYIMEDHLYYYRDNPTSVCNQKRGKPWNIPERIEKTLLKTIDIDSYDYREQLDRRLCIEIYSVVTSQMKREEPYRLIAKEIRKYLKDPYIRNIIRRCRFPNSKKWTLKKQMLKHKIIFPLFLRIRKG